MKKRVPGVFSEICKVILRKTDGRAIVAPLRIFFSFNNDGMDLCVWLQILQIVAVESICCRVLLLSLGFLLLLPREEKDVQLEKDNSRQSGCLINAAVKNE